MKRSKPGGSRTCNSLFCPFCFASSEAYYRSKPRKNKERDGEMKTGKNQEKIQPGWIELWCENTSTRRRVCNSLMGKELTFCGWDSRSLLCSYKWSEISKWEKWEQNEEEEKLREAFQASTNSHLLSQKKRVNRFDHSTWDVWDDIRCV
jgi:hypothetical protein